MTSAEQLSRGGARGAARQDAILAMLVERPQLDVATIASTFGVTTETVRRDLIALEKAGLAKRVHGGAVALDTRATGRSVPSVLERARLMTAQKRRIAERAIGLVPDEGLVLLDAGTTVFELARLIPSDTFASFVTAGLPTAIELIGHGVGSVHTLGGEIDPRTFSEGGAWALRSLSELSVDIAFIGVSGLTADRGATTTLHGDAIIKRAMLASAKSNVVLADSSKLDSVYVSTFADASELGRLVTDDGADPAVVAALREAGVEVLLA
jgi:DeoR family fructose operon transcriptional repressor